MKYRSLLAVGCLAASICIPQGALAQARPEIEGTLSGGATVLDQKPTKARTIFEFMIADTGKPVEFGSVVGVSLDGIQSAVKSADGVYSITNPAAEFELVFERKNQAPIRTKVELPRVSASAGLSSNSRASFDSQRQVAPGSNGADTFGNGSNFGPSNRDLVIRAFVVLGENNGVVSILTPESDFNSAVPVLMTKTGQLARPAQLGAGRAGDGCLDATPLVCGDTEVFTLQDFNPEGTPLTSSCEIAAGGPFTHDKSVWFEFTASSTAVQIDLCTGDPDQDSVMTLFTADSTCGALTELACDDDSCPGITDPPGFGAPQLVTGGLVIGQTYFVLVDFYSGGHDLPDDGVFDVNHTITVDCNVTLPEGACCQPGGACSIDTEAGCGLAGGFYQGDDTICDGSCPDGAGDVCSIAIDAFDGLNSDLIFDNGLDDPDPSCTTSGSADTWFKYTATTAGSLLIESCGTFDSAGTTIDTVMAVYDACGGNEIDCDDDCTSGGDDPDASCKDDDQTGTGATRDSCVCVDSVNVGDEFWIQVQEFGGDNFGDLSVTITPGGCDPPPPSGACCNNDGSCDDVADEGACDAQSGTFQGPGTECASTTCPVLAANDDCDIATVVDAVPYSDTVDNSTPLAVANGPAGSCDGFSATGMMQNDIWYEWTADRDCLLDVTATPVDSDYDVILVVRDNCTDLNELGCSDEDGGNFGEAQSLQVSVMAGTTYYFQVGDNGSFDGGGVTQFDLACFENTGACCTPDDCSVDTESNCDAAGGVYLGDDTTCEGTSAGNPVSFNSDVNVAIPDEDLVGVSDTINVADSFEIGDVNVSIQVDHEFLGDVDITLTHDGGTSIVLVQDACSFNDNYDITVDDSGADVSCATPTTGTFNPVSLNGEALSAFNGENSSGDWTLNVVDDDLFVEGTWLSWSIELDGVGAGPCDDVAFCNPDDCPAGSTPIIGVQDGNFAGWCVTGAPTEDVDFFFFAVDKAGDFATIEITKEFTRGPQEPTGLVPPILVTFTQVCDDEDTVGSIVLSEESVRNSTGVDWTDYHWTLFDANEVWFDVAGSSQWDVSPFTSSEFANFLDAPTNMKAKALNADMGIVPDNSQYFPGNGTGVLKMDVDLSGDPVTFTFKQRPTIDSGPDPDPTGACCVGTDCQVLTEADCGLASGTYQGDDAACTPELCDPTPVLNDTCEDATAVSCGDSLIGESNLAADGYTDDYEPGVFGNACTGFGAPGPDAIYELNLGTTQDVTILMQGAVGLDSSLYVVTDCGDTVASCLVGDDSTTGGGSEEVTFTADAGTTYFIIADAFGAAGGTFDLSLTCGGGPVGGACCNGDGSCDDVADEAACNSQSGTYQGDGTDCGSVSCPQPTSNDECEGRAPLACGATTIADLSDATNGAEDLGHTCSTSGNPCTEYFEFVPTGTSARIRTDLNSTAVDSVYTLYEVNQGAPCDESQWVEVGCSEDEAPDFLGDICVDGLTPGNTYVLAFTAFAEFRCAVGVYGIDVDCAATCTP